MKTTIALMALMAFAVIGCDSNKAAGENPTGAASTTNSTTAPTEEPKTEPASTATQGETKLAVPDRTPKDGEEVAVLETDKGRIVLMFFPDKAPKHVERFKMLCGKKFYDGTRFHRCIAGFMIQGGDPNSKDMAKAGMWGMGGYTENGKEMQLTAEFNDISHVPGILSAARSQDPNSASSQFFIVQGDAKFLDRNYTVYGQVVEGQKVVDEIVKTGDANNNGAVEPSAAIVLKSAKIEKWPLK